MDGVLRERIDRAKELLRTARHGAMATVNADGSPHNTPVFMILDEKLENIYWGSAPEALHSQNIERTGQLFLAVYEANKGGGLFMRAAQGHLLEKEELRTGLQVYNKRRANEGKNPLEISYYTGKSPQRMYGAYLEEFWVNVSERDDSKRVIRDYRHPVKRSQLL